MFDENKYQLLSSNIKVLMIPNKILKLEIKNLIIY